MMEVRLAIGLCMACSFIAEGRIYGEEKPLHGTQPLATKEGRSSDMRAGFRRFLLKELARVEVERSRKWRAICASRDAHCVGVKQHRVHLRKIIGAVDKRLDCADLELVASLQLPARLAQTARYHVVRVRWPVLPGVFGVRFFF